MIRKNEVIDEKDGSVLLHVPAGPFFVSNGKASIDIKEFYIDKHPITNKQYNKFIEETQHELPEFWEDERFNNLEQPVVGVNWEDATAYANWAGKRLPEENEWEKAARGTDGREYPWGNTKPVETLAVFDLDPVVGASSPVGKHPLGTSPYGCHDMSGNVWEWCQEWYTVGKYRVVRGGSWLNHLYVLKCSYRSCSVPIGKDNNVGFRCVKDV
ncbi:MAG: formylglycine-generating enzyme family protein [Planctomycetes bacterium]|nr:formylglycine-generating enzyme family protein [Planctomycetota bacterium]